MKTLYKVNNKENENNLSFVEIDLPKTFCDEKSHEILYLLFNNPTRTGGEGLIEEKSLYDSKALKALICYPNQMIAERVCRRNIINYDNFKFKVKLAKKEEASGSDRLKLNQKMESPELSANSLINNDRCQSSISEESISNSNVLKITDLSGSNKSLTIEKVNNKFLFVKDKIVGIEINQNTAIVKFDCAEGEK